MPLFWKALWYMEKQLLKILWLIHYRHVDTVKKTPHKTTMYLMHHNCDKLFMQSFGWIHEKSLFRLPHSRKYACLPAQIPAMTAQIAQGHGIKGSLMINSSLISTLKIIIIKFNIWAMTGEPKRFFVSCHFKREFLITWQIFQLFPPASKNNFDATVFSWVKL